MTTDNLTQQPWPSADDMPLGFRWGAAEAAVKRPGRLDVGMLVADQPCAAAGVFTVNAFAAAPVAYCRRVLAATGGRVRGVVANSGCANAATGPQGEADAAQMAREAAQAAGGGEFLVCSTGTIGVRLPMDRIAAGIRASAAALDPSNGFDGFSRSIMTTDTRRKAVFGGFALPDGRRVRIAACAKGSGMIHPRMATLLAFVATDAAVEPALLHELFVHAVDRSLNCVTVDRDTSTNDTALCLASGASGVTVAAGSPEARLLGAALDAAMREMAREIARDGEGATKLVEVAVRGAASFVDARAIALEIANSNLVKTAIYGRDANWGRIVCAIGNAPVAVDPSRVEVSLGPLVLFRDGAPLPLDEDAALAVLSADEVRIGAVVGGGPGEATAWTCDLTEKYIEINGSYRT